MKTKYQCEACKKLWDTEPEAQACEKSHVHLQPSDDTLKFYERFYEGERYPQELRLYFAPGGSITYQQERKQSI